MHAKICFTGQMSSLMLSHPLHTVVCEIVTQLCEKLRIYVYVLSEMHVVTVCEFQAFRAHFCPTSLAIVYQSCLAVFWRVLDLHCLSSVQNYMSFISASVP